MIDVRKEAIAVAEANKLGIPIIAVVDTNCAPEGIDYLVPGNDDASRAITLYCDLVARAALDGVAEQMGTAGIDIGELVEAPAVDVEHMAEAAGDGKDDDSGTESGADEGSGTEDDEGSGTEDIEADDSDGQPAEAGQDGEQAAVAGS